MSIIKSISGKLLCSMGYHKLITRLRPQAPALGREERYCIRCGFQFLTDQNQGLRERTRL